MNEHYCPITAPFDIRVDKHLVHPQVRALLREHIADMYAHSPADCVHTLDARGLRHHNVTFLTAWRIGSNDDTEDPSEDSHQKSEELVACGAIMELDSQHGEIKSMRTAARHLRQGLANAILTELLAISRRRGYGRVCLVTGSGPAFEAALAMYQQFGFVECRPFADYPIDPFSRFMALAP